MRPLLIAILASLVLPAAALGGGFATAGLSSTPEGVAPGEPWKVDITILQHGRAEAPMVGIEPAVIIKGADGVEQRFTGEETAKPGVYRAEVTFPNAGRFDYRVDDGFTNAMPHTVPAVTIREAAAPAPASSGGSDLPWWPLLLLAPALAAGAAFALRRRGAGGAQPA